MWPDPTQKASLVVHRIHRVIKFLSCPAVRPPEVSCSTSKGPEQPHPKHLQHDERESGKLLSIRGGNPGGRNHPLLGLIENRQQVAVKKVLEWSIISIIYNSDIFQLQQVVAKWSWWPVVCHSESMVNVMFPIAKNDWSLQISPPSLSWGSAQQSQCYPDWWTAVVCNDLWHQMYPHATKKRGKLNLSFKIHVY